MSRKPTRHVPGGCGLTLSEHERLRLLGEEAARIAAVAFKTLTTGYDHVSPERATKISNRGELEIRIAKLQAVVDLMCANGDVQDRVICSYQEAIEKDIFRNTRYQEA